MVKGGGERKQSESLLRRGGKRKVSIGKDHRGIKKDLERGGGVLRVAGLIQSKRKEGGKGGVSAPGKKEEAPEKKGKECKKTEEGLRD